MNDDRLIRLHNLRAAMRNAQLGGASDLHRRLGKSVSFWSDLLRGQKSFGEKLARDIEEMLELPRGALDAAISGQKMNMGELNGFEGQLVTLFRRLSPDEQHHLLAALDQRSRPQPPKQGG